MVVASLLFGDCVNVRVVVVVTTAVLVLGTTFALGSVFGAHRVRDRDEWVDGRLLSTAIDSVRANALDSLPSEELIKRAVSGMLRELHDPYAALLKPDGYQRYRGSLQGEGQGFGLTLRTQAGVVSVVRVAVGSPAVSAGLRPGDRVLTVNAIPVAEGWGRRAADTSATPLDTARLVVWRAPTGDTVRVALRRGQWHVPAVADAAMLADSIGYVRLASITAKASAEVEHAVDALRQRGARALVLDLRGNGGGLFDEGVNVAGLFLPRDAVVASLASRGAVPPERHKGRVSRWPTMPLSILVDAGTASASEVIAVGLREHGRALLVGAPTYGKGLVQRVVRLTPEFSLRLTTARWLTPNGNALQRRVGTGKDAHGGLLPDVTLADASRSDPFAVPREWTSAQLLSASTIADSAAMLAIREGWITTPVTELEARLRTRIAQPSAPSKRRRDLSRALWVPVATRLATARVLEIQRETESLLRFALRDDPALRAGLDLLESPTVVSRLLPGARP